MERVVRVKRKRIVVELFNDGQDPSHVLQAQKQNKTTHMNIPQRRELAQRNWDLADIVFVQLRAQTDELQCGWSEDAAVTSYSEGFQCSQLAHCSRNF